MLEIYLKLRIAAAATGFIIMLVLLAVWTCATIRNKLSRIRRRNRKKNK